MTHIMIYPVLTALVVIAINLAIGYRARAIDFENESIDMEKLFSEEKEINDRLLRELKAATTLNNDYANKVINITIENQDLKTKQTNLKTQIRLLTNHKNNLESQRNIYESALNKVDPNKFHINFTRSKSGKATPYARINKFTIDEAFKRAEHYESDVF